MKKVLQIIKISSIFTGAVLGAGFAGGKELYTFFVRYGKTGVTASLLSGVLFTLFGSLILYRAKKHSFKTYKSFINSLFGKRISYIFCAISDTFLLACFFIMLSGGGALFSDCFGLPQFMGSIITAVISYIVLSAGLDGISKVCTVLSPIMLFGIIYISTFAISKAPATPAPLSVNKNDLLFSAIIYLSYNMLSCAPALCTCASLAGNEKTAASGGIIGGICLTLLSYLACNAIFFQDKTILLSELPLLKIAESTGKGIYVMYFFILYMAILTTAFSTGLPLVKKIEGFGISQHSSALMLCAVALPLSFLKFSLLIEYCYTFFGYLGLIFLIKLLFFKNCRKQ